jgi:hypothetical protein
MCGRYRILSLASKEKVRGDAAADAEEHVAADGFVDAAKAVLWKRVDLGMT